MNLKFSRIFDKYIGSFALIGCTLFRRISKSRSDGAENKIKRILVIKLFGIGDSLLILPALRALKIQGQNIEIYTLSSNKNAFIFEHSNDVTFSFCIRFDAHHLGAFIQTISRIRSLGIDYAFDFGFTPNISALIACLTRSRQIIGFTTNRVKRFVFSDTYSIDGKEHTMMSYFNLVRLIFRDLKVSKDLDFNVKTNGVRASLSQKIGVRNLEDDNFVGIHPCSLESGTIAKHWLVERYALLADELIERYNVKVIFTGTLKETLFIKKIMGLMKYESSSMAGKTNIKELIALLKSLKLFIAIDSGPMHLASALQVPTIGIFGHDTPARYGPVWGSCESIYKPPPCSPCSKTYLGQWGLCDDPICMKMIHVADIVNKADTYLK